MSHNGCLMVKMFVCIPSPLHPSPTQKSCLSQGEDKGREGSLYQWTPINRKYINTPFPVAVPLEERPSGEIGAKIHPWTLTMSRFSSQYHHHPPTLFYRAPWESKQRLTFEQGQRGELHLGALVAELGRAVGPPLPGPAHGPAREAVHLLRGRHREAGGRGRAGRRQLGRLHDGGADGYAVWTCVWRELLFFSRVSA